jgi:hypothetical protein
MTSVVKQQAAGQKKCLFPTMTSSSIFDDRRRLTNKKGGPALGTELNGRDIRGRRKLTMLSDAIVSSKPLYFKVKQPTSSWEAIIPPLDKSTKGPRGSSARSFPVHVLPTS